MFWLIVLYLVALVAMVFLSIKLGDLVDLLDKKTKVSGAFIGSVLLGAVTSLPELFTSISSIFVVHNPSLVIGDIMGSDIFDMMALIVITFIFAKNFFEAKLSSKLHLLNLAVLSVFYLLALYAVFVPANYQIMLGDINLISIIIFIGYILLLIFSPKDSEDEKDETNSKLTIKQILLLFFLCAVLLISISVAITYLTDSICTKIGINGTAGGAILLGIATSIPEIISTAHLFRIKNYDAGYGNMIGSCTFNFAVISLADFMSWSHMAGNEISSRGIWMQNADSKLILIFGALTLISLIGFIALKSFTNLIKGKKSSFVVSGIFAAITLTFYILTFVL